jgi:hypothetical protein
MFVLMIDVSKSRSHARPPFIFLDGDKYGSTASTVSIYPRAFAQLIFLVGSITHLSQNPTNQP